MLRASEPRHMPTQGTSFVAFRLREAMIQSQVPERHGGRSLQQHHVPMTATLETVYQRLLVHFGPQHWWPAQSPFEILVGTVLTQTTSWRNVERAIENLREAGVLDPQRLYELPAEELEALIRPVGYFRIKAKRLRNLLR